MEESNHRLEIKEEGADIKTRFIPTKEVAWHEEVITETRTITVPVKREELVVETRYFMPDSDGELIKTEIERFPLREEHVEINMVPFQIQEISIYKQPVRSRRQIKTILQKEVLAVKTTGQGPEIEIIDID